MSDATPKLGELPLEMMLRMRDRYSLTQFVETGTGSGKTARMAAQYFDAVSTCEISPSRYGMLRMALPRSINMVCMSSPRFLRDIFANPDCKPALVWLDAHYCGGTKLGTECPLLEEIRMIGDLQGRHVLLIDDFRLFREPPPPPHNPAEWPSYGEIVDLIGKLNPTAVVSVEGDIIVVEPGNNGRQRAPR